MQLATWLLGLSLIAMLVGVCVSIYKIDVRSPYKGRFPGALTPFQQADQRREWERALNDPAHRTDKWAFYGLMATSAVSILAGFLLIVATLVRQ